ncbi:MAG: Oligopeptide transport system permease protein OppB [Verrucomicrobiota bacterium]|jgi:oligopeptide transport system permease protein
MDATALLRRLLAIPILVWVVATLAFFLMRAAPGGPFDRERAPASKEVEAALRARYHLDEPLWRQYVRYLAGLAQGDLGPSLKYRHHGVNDILGQALPVSMALGAMAFATAMAMGLPMGMAGALWRGRWPDWMGSVWVLVGVCIPTFVLAPLLVLGLALRLGWLPVAGWASPSHAVLPVLVLGLYFGARVGRLFREGLSEVLRAPFIVAARAKGVSPTGIVLRHALRPALLPVVSYAGPMLADLLTGSFVVERIFQVPGTGAFFINSFFSRDYPLMVGLVVVYSVLLLLLNLATDVAYRWLDPRIRHA